MKVRAIILSSLLLLATLSIQAQETSVEGRSFEEMRTEMLNEFDAKEKSTYLSIEKEALKDCLTVGAFDYVFNNTDLKEEEIKEAAKKHETSVCKLVALVSGIEAMAFAL